MPEVEGAAFRDLHFRFVGERLLRMSTACGCQAARRLQAGVGRARWEAACTSTQTFCCRQSLPARCCDNNADALVVGLHNNMTGHTQLNPPPDRVVRPGDSLITLRPGR